MYNPGDNKPRTRKGLKINLYDAAGQTTERYFMKLIHVRVLLDVRSEEWFKIQKQRLMEQSPYHKCMAEAFGELLENGHIQTPSGRVSLTAKGRDFLDGLEEVMRKYSG